MEPINEFAFSPTRKKKDRIYYHRFLYTELIRLSVLVDDVREQQLYGAMAALVKKAKYAVNGETEVERLEQLLHFFYQQEAFISHYDDYYYTNNLLLNKVLQHHRGMPVILGTLLLYFANVFNLPLYAINFPTLFILKIDLTLENGRKETRYINAADGSYLTLAEMRKWIEGEMGFGVEISRDFLRVTYLPEMLERLETVFKMALSREGKYPKALEMIQYRLRFEPDDPYEIRDRGMVLASLDCYQAAYEDLSYFIDQCPDDPSAMILKLEIAGLEKQINTNVFH